MYFHGLGKISFSWKDCQVVIDGRSGIAVDFTGKAVAVSPGEDFIVFDLGMSLQNASPEGWAESGSLIFETLLASIQFKE